MASSLLQLAATIEGRSKTLINNDLKKILKEEGLAQTGNKAALQARVIAFIDAAVATGNADTLHRLQYRVQNHGDAPSAASSPTAASFAALPPVMNAHAPAFASAQFGALHQMPPRSQAPAYFFRDSPFFEVRELVLSNITLEASPSHRQNCTRNLILNDSISARLKADSTLRLLLFSALETPLPPFTRTDITFPAQIEVRINGDEVKANYKGLKNKPGSTRPADITDLVRLSPANYRNNLVVTYALTHKKYNLFVYMVKKFSAADLTKQIVAKKVITKQAVLEEMRAKAADPDIEVGSSVMSLKDPISTLRINIPCRAGVCTHNQCFDAESFLQLQEQAPTWICPICSKTVHFNGLAVDEYVKEILAQVRNADQVTISPTGEWSTQAASPPRRNGIAADDSDDDFIEIVDPTDSRVSGIKGEAVQTPAYLSTPPNPSREPSTAPRSGTKRTSEVVDLTLSDDDEPPRPAKKVAYRPPTNPPEPSRHYELPPPLPRPRYDPHDQHSSHSSAYRDTRLNYPPRPYTPQVPPDDRHLYRPATPYRSASHFSGPSAGSSRYPTYLGSSSP
ncbi:E3 SUMO-protein ligase PIAS1 [Boeremia exigua]|uniref:E3 SUMO-protein ligase PIAS1 n=1 Tax=Boeremia exigua TaxID=749465 RepID=UPI001E8D7C81|nr:E3 SUMO-protein ligase PIAS1 [Boeremia exigua]KAH6622013.1 E3 SUMO-protein ligase PIAS1 [Boeremia exigua]